MNKITAWGITIIGALLIIQLLGILPVNLGDLTSGVTGWILAIVVLIIGIEALIRKYKK